MKAIIASLVLGLAISAHAADSKAPAADAKAPAATAPTAPAGQSAQSAPVANTKTPVSTAMVAPATKKVAKVNFKKECKEKLGKEATKADVKKCVAEMKSEAKASK